MEMNEVKLLRIRARLEALLTRREAMVSDNMDSRKNGKPQEFKYRDFLGIENSISDLVLELAEIQSNHARIIDEFRLKWESK